MRWGILGTGNIARLFAEGLSTLADATLLAVGSRSQETADAFGADFGVPRCYPSYEALVEDADVDAVYIATPHSFHKDHALLSLEHNKAVLCEKPFTLNAADTQIVIEKARDKGLFLMEAMWARYVPAMERARLMIADGAIGEIRMIQADFGFHVDYDPKHRLFDPHLGGGALLDVGIYPVSLTSMLLGAPDEIVSSAQFCDTGVDEICSMIFKWQNGAMATLSAATRCEMPGDAIICGTEGILKIHAPFWVSARLTLTPYGKQPQVIDIPYEGNGYNYEADEVAMCVRGGDTESDVMPLDESLEIMHTLDAIRAQWGLSYPDET